MPIQAQFRINRYTIYYLHGFPDASALPVIGEGKHYATTEVYKTKLIA